MQLAPYAKEKAAVVTVQMAVRRWALKQKWRKMETHMAATAADREAAAAVAAEKAAELRAQMEAAR